MKMRHRRGTIPRMARIGTVTLGQGDPSENDYLPLEDMTRLRSKKRIKKAVAFSTSQELISSALSTSNIGAQQVETDGPEDPSFPLERQAVKIVNEMEQDNSLMEDNPLSELRRLDTLREMPESLTLKRSVRRKLVNRVNQKSKRSPLSLYKRMKYRYSMSLSKFNFVVKNMLYTFEFWYNGIKVIEGHYGSSIATYFRFLRWLFFMNCIVCCFSHGFVIIPQILYDYLGPPASDALLNCIENNLTLELPDNLSKETNSSCQHAEFSIGNIFTGEGYFTDTSLYYGHYTNESWAAVGTCYYNIPMAYFFTFLFCYLFIFLSLSVSMARSYRKSFIETMGGVKNVYAHRIFCGWDFSIATDEASDLKSKCIYNELRELLCEEDKSEDEKNFKGKCHLLGVRLSVHFITFIFLIFTGGIMWLLLSANLGYDPETKYQSSMMMSLIVTSLMIISPIIFSFIIKFEEYTKPRVALYITLFRTHLLGMVIVGVLLAFWLERARRGGQGSNSETQCWETSLGQEVYRLILMDFFIAIIGTALAEFVRKRIYLTLWHKIGPPEFDIARNTLNLIYNETLFFVGFFFSPPLSLIIIIKMFITFYIKKIGVLKNCLPSVHTYRAAQTQTVFLVLSFLSLLGVIVVYGYILTHVKASDCGPFRAYPNMYQMVLEELLQLKGDHMVIEVIAFITKPGVVAGVLLGMCVGVYYLRAQSKAHIHMVDKLQDMLLLEAKDKEFLLTNISKVTRGAWIYNSKAGCHIFTSQLQPQPSVSNSKITSSEASNSSSAVSQKVSDWLMKSTGSTTADIVSNPSSSVVGEATRHYYKNFNSQDECSSISDSSVPTSVVDINDAQERKSDDPRLK